jgi:hypothetical protein
LKALDNYRVVRPIGRASGEKLRYYHAQERFYTS